MASIIYGTTDRTQGVLNYSISQSNTQVTITISSQLQAKTYRQSGYRIDSIIDGSVVDTALGYASRSYENFTSFLDTGNFSKTFDRGKADYAVVIGSSYYGETVSGYNPGPKAGNVSENIVIPALQSYIITYNANGGENPPQPQIKEYNQPLIITETQPTKSGYMFLGWSTRESATEAEYLSGGTYPSNLNADVTLYAVWSVSYFVPKIDLFSLYRSDQIGESQEDGTYATINFGWEIDQINAPLKDITIMFKKTSDGNNWTTAATIESNETSGTVTQIFGGELDITETYNVIVTITDSKVSISYNDILPLSLCTVDILPSGNGMALGKVAEEEDLLEVNWKTKLNKEVEIYNDMVNVMGLFSGGYGKLSKIGETVQGTALSNRMTNSWTNNYSITLGTGVWLLMGNITADPHEGYGFTIRLDVPDSPRARNVRQSTYCADTNYYSAQIIYPVITIRGGSQTCYLQTWTSKDVGIYLGELIAVRLS